MSKESLTELLTGKLYYPVEGMEKCTLRRFSELMERFGTTDFEKVVTMPEYEQIISEGMILGYAEERVYNGVAFGYHWGIDVMSEYGKPVYAADEGIIVKVNSVEDLSDKFNEQTYGNYVIVLREYEKENVFTLYGHLGYLGERYTKGQSVSRGQLLGVMGMDFTVENGGWPQHLHFQMGLSIEGLNPYGGRELEEITLNPEKIFGLR